MSKLFLERLASLEEGTAEFPYVRNTLVEMNLTLVPLCRTPLPLQRT
ncbi:hypothetical protein [Streptomyces caniferus]